MVYNYLSRNAGSLETDRGEILCCMKTERKTGGVSWKIRTQKSWTYANDWQ